jgi:hypothetical protein
MNVDLDGSNFRWQNHLWASDWGKYGEEGGNTQWSMDDINIIYGIHVNCKSIAGKHGSGKGEGRRRVEGEHRWEQRGVGGQHWVEEETDTEQYKGRCWPPTPLCPSSGSTSTFILFCVCLLFNSMLASDSSLLSAMLALNSSPSFSFSRTMFACNWLTIHMNPIYYINVIHGPLCVPPFLSIFASVRGSEMILSSKVWPVQINIHWTNIGVCSQLEKLTNL